MGKLKEALKTRVILLDGSMGALLGMMGYQNACPDRYALEKPEIIRGIHEKYLRAGADAILADCFGSTEMALAHKQQSGMGAVYTRAAVQAALRACGGRALVGADMGPTSEFAYPVGAHPARDFFDTYYAQAVCARDAGADFAMIETQTDLAECRAACLAAVSAGLEAAASFTFGANGRTLTGATPECCARALTAAGATALGVNCSSGPEEMRPILRKMRACTPLPILVQPNAGLPAAQADGTVRFPVTPEGLLESMRGILADGAGGIGGCCGTTPAHIRALRAIAGGTPPAPACEAGAYVCGARAQVLLAEAAAFAREVADIDDLYDLDEDARLAVFDLRGLCPEEAETLAMNACACTQLPLGFRADDAEALDRALFGCAGIAAVYAPSVPDGVLQKYGALRL